MLALLPLSTVEASNALPYSQRSHSYNGYIETVLGDIRTVGMAGATVGLADTFLAASTNPAGLSMTLNTLDTNITRSELHDGYIQNYDQPINTPTSFGLAANIYPWGFSLGVIPYGSEGTTYLTPNVAQPFSTGNSVSLYSETHEFRIGVSRLLLDNRLAIGMSLNLGVGEEECNTTSSGGPDDDRHAIAIGGTLGLMYQLPNRILLGAAYTLPMHYQLASLLNPASLSGFFQDLDTPPRLEFGLGWIPNRFVRGAFQLSWVGSTRGAALIANDNSLVGFSDTLQPRLGTAYIFMDYRNFQGTVFLGTYLESSRIENTTNRFHETTGLEIKAWIFTLGGGFDIAPAYKNSLYSIGVDLGAVLQGLKIIPTPWIPPYGGLFPSPFHLQDEGLARPLVKNWQPKGPDMNPVKIVEQVPKNINKEVNDLVGKIKKNPEEGPPPH